MSDGRMNQWVDGWLTGWMDGWLEGWISCLQASELCDRQDMSTRTDLFLNTDNK